MTSIAAELIRKTREQQKVPAAGMALAASAATAPLTRVHVSQRYYSADMAVKLSLPFGSLDMSGSDFMLIYEAMLETDPVAVLMKDVWWEDLNAIGIALQIAIKSFDANVRLDIASVAAAAQLGLVRAQFAIEVFPSDATAIQELLPATSGVLDPSNVDAIIAGVAAAKQALGQASGLVSQRNVRPAQLISSMTDQLGASQSMAFAAKMVAKNKFVETAIDNARDRQLNETIVRLTYETFWPGVKEGVDPPTDARNRARDWLGWARE